jgi:hypothetical protein
VVVVVVQAAAGRHCASCVSAASPWVCTSSSLRLPTAVSVTRAVTRRAVAVDVRRCGRCTGRGSADCTAARSVWTEPTLARHGASYAQTSSQVTCGGCGSVCFAGRGVLLCVCLQWSPCRSVSQACCSVVSVFGVRDLVADVSVVSVGCCTMLRWSFRHDSVSSTAGRPHSTPDVQRAM